MKPLIAITVGEVVDGERWIPLIHGQFHTYPDAITRAGGAPFMAPIINDKDTLRHLYEKCDGLLLTGGVDLAPDEGGVACPPTDDGEPCRLHDRPFSPRRDRQEVQLLKWALADNKPVLGICRGMQVMNSVLGGSLYHDIKSDLPGANDHEASIHRKEFGYLAHDLAIDEGSRLAGALGTTQVKTNSLHHQAVKKLGDGLVVTSRDEDGVIEAVELPDKFFAIGVQCHPEALEAEAEPLWRKLFEAFVSAARKPG